MVGEEHRIAQGSERELAESVGVLSDEQKAAAIARIRAGLAHLHKPTAFFSKATRWTLCMFAFSVLATSGSYPQAAFGATFQSLSNYIERMEAERAAEEAEDDDEWPS